MGAAGQRDVRPLPEFDQPPLVEVALGVIFEPVDIGIVGLADLHRRWAREFPVVEEHPALPPIFAPAAPGFLVEVGPPAVRLWMLTAGRDRLVQVQRDRIVVNWRRTAGSGYPRYGALREMLDRQHEDLVRFLTERSLPAPKPVAVEATYVNVIEAVQPSDFLAAMNQVPQDLGELVEASVSMVFERTGAAGEPQRVVVHAARNQSAEANFILRISVLEQVASAADVDISLHSGHEQAVRTFAAVTSPMMHKQWRRQS